MQLAPTPRDTLRRDGTASLYRFRGARTRGAPPLLLVPSLINRWYVLDLRRGSSLVEALVEGGIDTYCLDWGGAEDEDRFLGWDDVVARLRRAVRRVRRETGAPRIGLLGYCMGGTLAGIYAALRPHEVSALVNLAGPFDFAKAGALAEMVDPRWFDGDAIAAAGNVSAAQMQSGFVMLRPTLALAKWVGFLDRAHDARAREAFAALETWAADNIAFPAAAYATYIRELYQENRLVRGEHAVRGEPVDLASITCPVLSIVASKDTICPPSAALALNERCGATERHVLTVDGGHVGAVVGRAASRELYPALVAWLRAHLDSAPSNSN